LTGKAELHPSRFETSDCQTTHPRQRGHTSSCTPHASSTSKEWVSCAMLPKTFECTRKRRHTYMVEPLLGVRSSRSQNHPTTANMAPHSNRTDSFTTADSHQKPKLTKATPPRNVEWIEQVEWDSSLQPKDYEIQGTHPDSKILFLNVNILDSTGREPYLGDVLIQGQRHASRSSKSINESINTNDRSNNHRRWDCTQCRRTQQRPQSPSLPRSRTHFDVGFGRRSHTLHMERRRS
jgi:hypothetical protein